MNAGSVAPRHHSFDATALIHPFASFGFAWHRAECDAEELFAELMASSYT